MKESFLEDIRKIFVTSEVFNLRITPLEKIVYGFVGLALVSIASGILILVVKSKP